MFDFHEFHAQIGGFGRFYLQIMRFKHLTT